MADTYSDYPQLAGQIRRARDALAEPAQFLSLLESGDTSDAQAARVVLNRESVDSNSIPAFLAVAHGARMELRLAAMGRLRWNKERVVLAFMLEALKDPEAAIRSEAAAAIGKGGVGAAIDLVAHDAAALRATLKTGADAAPVIKAIVKLGGAEAFEALAEVLADGTAEQRVLAAAALPRLDDRRVIGVLRGALHDTAEQIRSVAASALAEHHVRMRFLGNETTAELQASVAVLAGMLQDPDVDVQCGAVNALGRLGASDYGPQPVEPVHAERALLEAVAISAKRAARDALSFLVKVGAPQLTPALARALDGDDVGMKRMAAHALLRSPDPLAQKALHARIGDSDSFVRSLAVEAIVASDEPGSIAALERAVGDETAAVRSAAIAPLARKLGRKALPALIRALRDADEEAREEAAMAIAPFGEVQAIPALLDLLATSSRYYGQRALHEIRDPAAIPHFIAALRSDSEGQRELARQWLVHYRRMDARAPLQALLDDPDEKLRAVAREALAAIVDPAGLPALLQGLCAGESSERWKAVYALWKVADAMPAAALVEQAAHPDRRVRRVLARFLGRLHGAAAKPALEQMCGDADPDVRWWAQVALEDAGPSRGLWDELPMDGHVGFSPPPAGAGL